MAEEENEEVVEGEEPKKGGNLKLIIIIVVALAVLGGGGVFAWFKFIAPAIGAGDESTREEGEKAESKESAEVGMETGTMFPLDPFILNLAGEGGKRFLKLAMVLELSDAKLSNEIKNNIPKIKDSILILLSSKTFKDIYTVEGKFKLRDEITARINRFLVSGHIKNVYFTEFVIQ